MTSHAPSGRRAQRADEQRGLDAGHHRQRIPAVRGGGAVSTVAAERRRDTARLVARSEVIDGARAERERHRDGIETHAARPPHDEDGVALTRDRAGEMAWHTSGRLQLSPTKAWAGRLCGSKVNMARANGTLTTSERRPPHGWPGMPNIEPRGTARQLVRRSAAQRSQRPHAIDHATLTRSPRWTPLSAPASRTSATPSWPSTAGASTGSSPDNMRNIDVADRDRDGPDQRFVRIGGGRAEGSRPMRAPRGEDQALGS